MKRSLFAALFVFTFAPLHAQTSGNWQGATPTPTPEPSATPTPKATPNLAGTRPSSKPIEEQVAAFFKHLGEGKVQEAYNGLLQGSRIAAMSGQVDLLHEKTSEALKLMGKFQGHELIEKKAVGEYLQRFTYLSRGAYFPMRWRLYYYQTQEGWRLVDIRITDRLIEIFAEEIAVPTSGEGQ